MASIRLEREEDYREVEEMTKKAFWNVYTPGCEEHYLVHTMRSHKDFIPELDLVIEEDHHIIGSIMHVRSKLVDENGTEKEVLTFGPLGILPEYQRQGYGKQLLEYAFQKARQMGFDTVVIFGNPENYISRGFKNCKKFNVAISKEVYPVSLLVKELKEGALQGKKWIYQESSAYQYDDKKVEAFDRTFEKMEKKYQMSQELFDIYSHSSMNP